MSIYSLKMSSKIYSIFFFIFFTISSSLCDVEITINQGKIRGLTEKSFLKNLDYMSFKAIPFAVPPVGELRFKPPVPLQSWEGSYEAFVNKPTCLQFNTRARLREKFGISGSEDCLHLSVFTPSLGGQRPVVVFDFNDNFRTGFNGTDTYSPDFFIEDDVVVVTISHRLGLFGYLTTEDDEIPGNNGLRDFILGLKWIQDNIQYFGGDPKCVTLMGNRGGAALMELLLYTEQAEGLFSRIIMQSGTALEATYFYDNPRDVAFKFGEVLNITTSDSTTLLEQLQKIDAEVLIKNEVEVIDENVTKKHQMSVHPFSPTVEYNNPNGIITALPEKSKIVNDVPVLIGFNSREGIDLGSHFILEPKILDGVKLNLFSLFPIRSGFRFDHESEIFTEAMKEINDFYYKDGSLTVNNILDYSLYIGDVLHIYAIHSAAKRLGSDLKSPVYYYVFDYRGLLNENSELISSHARFSIEYRGATVADELCYLHLCSGIKRVYDELNKRPSRQTEFKVLEKMVRLWTNFAKTGNPTAEDPVFNNFLWTPVSSDTLHYAHITKSLTLKSNPFAARMKFWEDFLDKYSKMAANGVVPEKERHEEL